MFYFLPFISIMKITIFIDWNIEILIGSHIGYTILLYFAKSMQNLKIQTKLSYYFCLFRFPLHHCLLSLFWWILSIFKFFIIFAISHSCPSVRLEFIVVCQCFTFHANSTDFAVISWNLSFQWLLVDDSGIFWFFLVGLLGVMFRAK